MDHHSHVPTVGQSGVCVLDIQVNLLGEEHLMRCRCHRHTQSATSIRIYKGFQAPTRTQSSGCKWLFLMQMSCLSIVHTKNLQEPKKALGTSYRAWQNIDMVLTPNICRRSGSRNRKGMFETCSRLGWDLFSVFSEGWGWPSVGAASSVC